MIKLNFLNTDFEEGLQIVAKSRGFAISKDGINVNIIQGDSLTVKNNANEYGKAAYTKIFKR